MSREGNCYQLAYETYLTDVRLAGHCVLVHGYPRLQVDSDNNPKGTKYGHAWVEILDVICWDPVKDMYIPKDSYYLLGMIDESECVKYTKSQMLENAQKFGTYGPWENVPDDAKFLND